MDLRDRNAALSALARKHVLVRASSALGDPSAPLLSAIAGDRKVALRDRLDVVQAATRSFVSPQWPGALMARLPSGAYDTVLLAPLSRAPNSFIAEQKGSHRVVARAAALGCETELVRRLAMMMRFREAEFIVHDPSDPTATWSGRICALRAPAISALKALSEHKEGWLEALEEEGEQWLRSVSQELALAGRIDEFAQILAREAQGLVATESRIKELIANTTASALRAALALCECAGADVREVVSQRVLMCALVRKDESLLAECARLRERLGVDGTDDGWSVDLDCVVRLSLEAARPWEAVESLVSHPRFSGRIRARVARARAAIRCFVLHNEIRFLHMCEAAGAVGMAVGARLNLESSNLQARELARELAHCAFFIDDPDVFSAGLASVQGQDFMDWVPKPRVLARILAVVANAHSDHPTTARHDAVLCAYNVECGLRYGLRSPPAHLRVCFGDYPPLRVAEVAVCAANRGVAPDRAHFLSALFVEPSVSVLWGAGDSSAGRARMLRGSRECIEAAIHTMQLIPLLAIASAVPEARAPPADVAPSLFPCPEDASLVETLLSLDLSAPADAFLLLLAVEISKHQSAGVQLLNHGSNIAGACFAHPLAVRACALWRLVAAGGASIKKHSKRLAEAAQALEEAASGVPVPEAQGPVRNLALFWRELMQGEPSWKLPALARR